MTTTELDREFEYFSRVSTLSKKSICWTCIYRFSFKNNLENLLVEDGEDVIDFLESTLIKYDCSETDILYRLLGCIFGWYFYNFGCDEENDELSGFRVPFEKVLLDYGETPLSRMNLEFYPCFCHAKFLLVLSKYGIHIEDSIFNINKAEITIENFFVAQEADTTFNSSQELTKFTAEDLDGFMACKNHSSYKIYSRGERYKFLAIRTLNIVNDVLTENEIGFENMTSLWVFYRTIPDPFVSREDMKDFLRILLGPQSRFLAKTIAICTKLFRNEGPSLYLPRTLKHLCRISIRHELRKNFIYLPNSVRKLDIPRELHDYLLCVEPIIY